ncbi:MAG TPA: glycine betaine/L-proline ABC transporter ATP-binding protein [Firmicutes bacterium]|jgi:glycine betaine/proline transport system ATP-binding protein|nr:glycine betaine/L-proline ABC transporter ATP-binding protein [Bacillota bacterium]
MPKIEVRNLYKVFGPHPLQALKKLQAGLSKERLLKQTGHTVGIHNVSFTVEQGEIFVVMGLSGSGKSTLVRCINRLIEPTDGEVYIDGENVTGLSLDKLRLLRQKKLAMVFQRFALFPHRTILQNVAYGLEIQGIEKKVREEKAYEVLQTVGLKDWAAVYPEQLSGGMQQRVGLARALAVNPDILLMDEPFSALDPLIRKEMQEELMELQEKLQKTIIFITHDLDEALKLGDNIAIMKDGLIDQIGTPEEILTNPATEYVANFVTDVDRSRVLRAENIMIRPTAHVSSNDGPRVALRKMKEEALSSIFVIGDDRTLVGIVTVDRAVEAVKHKVTDLKKIVETDIPVTSPDTLIQDLLPMAVTARVPIAVIDENKKLMGIIVRVTVLAGLLGGGEDSNDVGDS